MLEFDLAVPPIDRAILHGHVGRTASDPVSAFLLGEICAPHRQELSPHRAAQVCLVEGGEHQLSGLVPRYLSPTLVALKVTELDPLW